MSWSNKGSSPKLGSLDYGLCTVQQDKGAVANCTSIVFLFQCLGSGQLRQGFRHNGIHYQFSGPKKHKKALQIWNGKNCKAKLYTPNPKPSSLKPELPNPKTEPRPCQSLPKSANWDILFRGKGRGSGGFMTCQYIKNPEIVGSFVYGTAKKVHLILRTPLRPLHYSLCPLASASALEGV